MTTMDYERIARIEDRLITIVPQHLREVKDDLLTFADVEFIADAPEDVRYLLDALFSANERIEQLEQSPFDCNAFDAPDERL